MIWLSTQSGASTGRLLKVVITCSCWRFKKKIEYFSSREENGLVFAIVVFTAEVMSLWHWPKDTLDNGRKCLIARLKIKLA